MIPAHCTNATFWPNMFVIAASPAAVDPKPHPVPAMRDPDHEPDPDLDAQELNIDTGPWPRRTRRIPSQTLRITPTLTPLPRFRPDPLMQDPGEEQGRTAALPGSPEGEGQGEGAEAG